MPQNPLLSDSWAYLPTLVRLALAVGTGVFVGLERERRGKAGVRTFAFASLMGCLGALLGDAYAIVCLALLGLLVIFINCRQLSRHEGLELTTSAALVVTGLAGILCGKGHTFTPVAVAVVTTALLAWKEPLSGFVLGLREAELRSGILLAILSFVIYPVLPDHPVDPWGLIDPRSSWATVILMAALGFVNYALWKIYGARGSDITGFLGGLVNSTAAVAEIAVSVRGSSALVNTAYRGVMLACTAMLMRNFVVVALLAPPVLKAAALPLLLMLLAGAALTLIRLKTTHPPDTLSMPPLKLEVPFSLQAALKFGLLFLLLQVAGTLGRRFLGILGFYGVSITGGLFSSASAVASAATLAAHHKIGFAVAANGAVLASLTSALVNIPVVARVANQRPLTLALTRSLGIVTLAGIAGMVAQSLFGRMR